LGLRYISTSPDALAEQPLTSSLYGKKVRAFVIPSCFFLLLICLSGLSISLSRAARTHFDFRTQYTAGHMARTGHGAQLYDYEETRQIQNEKVSWSDKALPFIHLAYEALLYVPFSFFSYQTAYFLFLAVNFGLLAWAYCLMKPYLLRLVGIWPYLPIVLFLCFLPVTMTLMEGQNSILLLVIIILSLLNLHRGNDFWAGILLGLASMKFQYVIPVALLFLVWRRWRFLGGIAISAFGVVVISVWLTGVTGFVSYLHLLGNMSARFSSQTGVHLGVRPELMPNLRGLIYAVGGGPSPGATLVTIFLSAGLLLWTATRPPSLSLAMLAALLVSYHQTFTDAALLIVPLGMAAASYCETATLRARYVLLICAAIIGAPVVLLLTGVRFYLLALPALALLFLWDASFDVPATQRLDLGPSKST
jgi:Glycosyltransferase family 87